MTDHASAELYARSRALAPALAGRLQLSLLASRAVTTGLGLFAIAGADYRARHGLAASEPIFWLGLLILVVPIALALWSPVATRAERLGLVLLLGVGLWGTRLLYDPTGLVFYDEFSHWRSAIDIATTGRLFTPNPLQPISPLYPGLESLTAMLSSLAGLPLDMTGLLVILAGRIVLVLGLFVFFERATRSARAAGLAVLVYAANPSFLFFDAQFAYESFALGLAALALALLALRADDGAPGRGLALLAALAIAATVVTHHITSYALILFVLVWSVAGLLRRSRQPGDAPPLAVAVFGLLAALAWLTLVAASTVAYIAPHVVGGVEQIVQLIAGGGAPRQLFQDSAGAAAPIWERIVGYASVLLILVALPFGFLAVWRRHRQQPVALALVVVTLGYPAALVMRLTTAGAESAGRALEFLFLGIAFVIAVWASGLAASAVAVARRRLAILATVVVYVGGVVIGTAFWARLPYPFRPAADPRSVSPEGILAADWTRLHLGPGNVFATDRTDRQLLGSYGRQNPTFASRSAVILLSPSLAVAQRAIVALHIDYVLVDTRLSEAVPLVSGYVVQGELGGYQWTSPVPEANLKKLNSLQGASRIFDSGDIRIYDVRSIR